MVQEVVVKSVGRDMFTRSQIPAPLPEEEEGVVVRETRCRTILNRCAISDYSLNCYTGCAHGCAYCYARLMQRFHPHDEPWGGFVDVKANAVETLERQLARAKPGAVFVSSACDGWQPIEAKRGLTRECCRVLLAHGFEVNVLTKSALVRRDFDILKHPNATIGVTVTTLAEGTARLWEPKAASVEERFRVLEEAHKAGISTTIMFGPLLPELSDSEGSIEAMLARAGDAGVDRIWVDALNPRPRVWPSVAGLLRREFPELRRRYSRVLFDPRVREEYLGEVHGRVERAARKAGVADRVAGCM
ncbi:MAG: radical SAM protein [Planctomycetota bacterium]